VSRNIPHVFVAGKARVFSPDAVRKIEAAIATGRDTQERRLSRVEGDLREAEHKLGDRLDKQLKLITTIGVDMGANATAILQLRNELIRTHDFIGKMVEAIAENRECLRAMAEFMKANTATDVVTKPAPIDKNFLTLN